ncbi:MAG: hypothetical protein QXG02_00570 [Candidatus Anstonellales archaeon]
MNLLRVFLLSLFFSFIFSGAYEDPPIPEVFAHNQQIAPSLVDYIPPGQEGVPTYDEPVSYASMKLLTIDPSIDDRIAAEDMHYLIWTWGEHHGDDLHKDVGGGCDGHKNENVLVSKGKPKVSGNITFSFMGRKKTVEINPDETRIQVPFATHDLWMTNGHSELKATLDGQIEFPYTLKKIRWHEECDEDEEGGEDCHCEKDVFIEDATIVKEFYSSIAYTVEGGNVVFFTFQPPIGEQWYVNNHFNNLIFSKRKFYRFVFYIDGMEYGRRQLYTFDTHDDVYDVWYIESERDEYGDGESEETWYKQNVKPYLIEEIPETFCYIYRSDFPHYPSFGPKIISTEAYDHFLRTYKYDRFIAHRENTAGNYYGDAFYRPSVSYDYGKINMIYFVFPFLLVILIVLIFYR